eukprot:CAMPEP_0170478964 /NCGR_PEP_ID=MMETSP0208-20121228/368_1 /TAXON_ID=197538 /ORGANISM="Strombidium inclinatum, Strain S3" /LENGTH=90 /DNA_ID=CAMNT_0010751299 /DNA_START=6 /DNA_END=278 /DNA_ORIENTATION=-
MKVWSTLALLLGAANASEPTEAAEGTDATTYHNFHYCTSSSQCGTYKCGHYSYYTYKYQHHYDYKTCVAPSLCGKTLKRGISNAYVYCYY